MSIAIREAMHLPPAVVREALFGILGDIGARKPPYDQIALSLGLREVRLPVEATVEVPVEVQFAPAQGRWESHISIEAASRPGLFPRFEGSLSVTPDGGDRCELWLQGVYSAPFGALGRGGDATVMRGAAEASLQTFLKWLAAQVADAVERRERERIRQSRYAD